MEKWHIAIVVIIAALLVAYVARRALLPKCPDIAGQWKKANEPVQFAIVSTPSQRLDALCDVKFVWAPNDANSGYVPRDAPATIRLMFGTKEYLARIVSRDRIDIPESNDVYLRVA